MIDLELTALADLSFMGFILQARELDNKDRQVGLTDARTNILYWSCTCLVDSV
jgi:hypothetical protein